MGEKGSVGNHGAVLSVDDEIQRSPGRLRLGLFFLKSAEIVSQFSGGIHDFSAGGSADSGLAV